MKKLFISFWSGVLIFSLYAASKAQVSLQEAYVQAQEKLGGTDVPDHVEKRLVENWVSEFPMIPNETNIKDFPSPISEEEKDPKVLHDYYINVATAYYEEAKRLQDASTEAHERQVRTQNDLALGNLRTQDRKLDNDRTDLTLNKQFLSPLNAEKPFKSQKHVPPSLIHQQANQYYKRRYQDTRVVATELTLKGDFYTDIAQRVYPTADPAKTPEGEQTQTAPQG